MCRSLTRGLAAQADQYVRLFDAGYTDVWTLEASGWDALTPLAMVASRLPDARFGTAIVPVFTRGAATLVGHTTAMAELFGERFTLGIGASTSTIVEDWNGIAYQDPYLRTLDTLRFLKRALTGEKVTEDFGTFAVRGYRRERPPETMPTFMVAALRAGMLQLAGRHSDGAILSWVSATDVERLARHVGPDRSIAARIFVCLGTDRRAVLAAARRQITWYMNTPAYRAFQQWLGRSEDLSSMWQRWDAGDRRGAVEAVPEHVVDDLVVNGTAEQCIEHVLRYRAAGVDTPLVHVIPVGKGSFETALELAPGRH